MKAADRVWPSALLPLLSFVALSLASAVPVRAYLRVVGTDLLGSAFTAGLSDAGIRARIDLRVTLDGSVPGLSKLQTGSAGLGLFFLPPGAQPPAAPLRALPLAYLAVAVVAHAENPLANISLRQLASVFGPRDPGAIQRWGDLVLGDSWQTRPVVPHAPAPAGGLAHDLFRHAVLGERSFRENLQLHANADELIATAASNPGALAFIPWPVTNAPRGLKFVPISKDAVSPAYSPEARALHRGDYPLRLPLWIVFRGEACTELAPLLRILLSEEGAGLLAAAGVVPLPPEIRTELALELTAGLPSRAPGSGK